MGFVHESPKHIRSVASTQHYIGIPCDLACSRQRQNNCGNHRLSNSLHVLVPPYTNNLFNCSPIYPRALFESFISTYNATVGRRAHVFSISNIQQLTSRPYRQYQYHAMQSWSLFKCIFRLLERPCCLVHWLQSPPRICLQHSTGQLGVGVYAGFLYA